MCGNHCYLVIVCVPKLKSPYGVRGVIPGKIIKLYMKNIDPQAQLIANLKKKIEEKRDIYSYYHYWMAIKTVAGTLNLDKEYPLLSSLEGKYNYE